MKTVMKIRRKSVDSWQRGAAVAFGVLVSLSAVTARAQEETEAVPAGAMAAAAEEAVPDGPGVVRVGSYVVQNAGPFVSESRKENRDRELWRSYMHGVVDYFAEPTAWSDLLATEQSADDWLASDVTLSSQHKRSDMPSLRLGANRSITLGRALPVRPEDCRGKTLRVFIWMRGDEVGMGADSWNASPSVEVIRYNVDGEAVQRSRGLFRTRWTFPWHCYYVDVPIPSDLTDPVLPADEEGEAAAEGGEAEESTGSREDSIYRTRGLYLRLANPVSGTAFFSTVSWEIVTPDATYDNDEKQDPATGSLAPNPRYDELPYHLCWGKGRLHRWNFLLGSRGGALRCPDLSAPKGFEKYYLTAAKKDPTHCLFAVSRLAEWYTEGKRLDLLPAFRDDWPAKVAGVLAGDQDVETGFWGYDDLPKSLATTAAYVTRLFADEPGPRADRAAVARPWLALVPGGPPNPERIAVTVLSLRSTVPGTGTPGAWGSLAFGFRERDEQDAGQGCSLAATAAALNLLRALYPHVSTDRRREIEAAMDAAWLHVRNTCLYAEGVWKLSDQATAPSSPAFFPEILNALPYLERRGGSPLSAPKVTLAAGGRGSGPVIAWDEPAAEAVSLRVYAVTKGTASSKAGPTVPIGIIEKGDTGLLLRDPLLAADAIRTASTRLIGANWKNGQAEYVVWKLDQLPSSLAAGVAGSPLRLPVLPADVVKLQVVAVDSLGRESKPATVSPAKEESAPRPQPATGGREVEEPLF